MNVYDIDVSHCRASGGMAIFLGVSAAPERIFLSKISYAPVQHSLSQPDSFIVSYLLTVVRRHLFAIESLKCLKC